MEKISGNKPTFYLKDISDPQVKEFLRNFLEEAYQQTIPDNAELNADEAFSALDLNSNGIVNLHDYERFAHSKDDSFSVFSRAVLFLERHRKTDSPVSPYYSCEFLEDDWLRDVSVYPDEASIENCDPLQIQGPPRFTVKFHFSNEGDQYGLGPLRMHSLIDVVLLNNGLVRLELFKDSLDRKSGLVTRAVEVSLEEIKKMDNEAACFLSGETGSECSYFSDTFKVSDEFLGYIWKFVKAESIVSGQQDFDYEPLGWAYQIYDIPDFVSPRELPRYILEQYNGDSLQAVKALRETLLSEVFVYLPEYFHEEELDIIMQSSFVSPFGVNEITDEDQLRSMLAKVDLLRFIQNDPQSICLLYQLPRQLRNILLLYIFNDYPEDMSSIENQKEALYRRMNEALEFAQEITPRLDGNLHPKKLLIDVLVQTREWFPQIDFNTTTFDAIWRWANGPYEDEEDKFWGFYDSICFLSEHLFYRLSTKHNLNILKQFTLATPLVFNGNEGGEEVLADLIEDLGRGGFITPYIDSGMHYKGMWYVVDRISQKDLPYSLLMGKRYFLKMYLEIGNGYKVSLHELFHMVHNYGAKLNHLDHDDYVIDGKAKKGKLPNWLDEALTEYFAQEEMRKRGLDSGSSPAGHTKISYRDGVMTILSLIKTYGESLKEAFQIAYLSGDYTKVRDILGQNIFRKLMLHYDRDGDGALKWAKKIGIETDHNDWP